MHELFNAIILNNINLIHLILKNPKNNINNIFENNENALFFSLKKQKNLEIIQILIKYGIEINQIDKEGNTPLHISLKNGYKNLSLIFLKNDFKMINHINKLNENVLTIAIKKKYREIIYEIFKYDNLDINFVDNNKNSILINLIQYLDEEICIDMVSKFKINLNYLNSYDFDALILSMLKNYEKLAIILIKMGSNYNYKNKSNFNSIQIAEKMGFENFLNHVKEAKEELIIKNLKKQSSSINNNQLFSMIYNNNEDFCIRYLKKNKINFEILDKNSNTLLINSIKLNMFDLSNLLINIGSEKFIKQINNNRENALLISLKKKKYFLALNIIEKKCYDINLIDKYNCNALLLSIDSEIEDLCLKLFNDNKTIIHVNIIYNNEYTLLMYALLNNMFKLSSKIIDKIDHKNLNFINKENNCALNILLKKNNYNLLKQILLKKEINIDIHDSNGESFLNKLICLKHFDLVEFILKEKKGNIYFKNKNGEDAYFLLKKLNIKYLLHYF